MAPTLPADAPAHLAFDRLMRSPHGALAVLDNDGAFLGIVTAPVCSGSGLLGCAAK